jgi:hypothetical protein
VEGRKEERKVGNAGLRIDYSKQKAQNGLIFKIQVSEYDKIKF